MRASYLDRSAALLQQAFDIAIRNAPTSPLPNRVLAALPQKASRSVEANDGLRSV
ncbi:MAG TPA: hypothetical protein VFJ70_23335 [Burkholderiales bacterium]|nr:hypothetical protein [Burkholderiales bacterium]